MSDVMRNGYPSTAEEYEEAIDQMLAEMRALGEKTRQTQREIERIRSESEPVRAEIQSMLASMGKPV